MNHVTHPLGSAGIHHFFKRKSKNFVVISKNIDIDWILIHNPNSFNFSWVFEHFFNKSGYSFDDFTKNGSPGLLKIMVFWNKGYDVIILVDDVNRKILSRDSNYIVDVFMWPKFGNPSISMKFYISVEKVRKFWGLIPTFVEVWSFPCFFLASLGLLLSVFYLLFNQCDNIVLLGY